MKLENRSGHALQTAPQGRLSGYAAVFNAPSHDLGGFREIIKPGAFAKSLKDAPNVRALYDHDTRQVLGTTRADTLQLREDANGLRFELQLPETSYAKDLSALVARGDVAGCSFAFRVRPGGEAWEQRNGETVRILSDVELAEITVTANPAYPDTEVALRSMPTMRLSTQRLWLETLTA